MRLMRRAPRRASILLTALETVALEVFAAPRGAGERAAFHHLGEDRQPSKSGSLPTDQSWKQ